MRTTRQRRRSSLVRCTPRQPFGYRPLEALPANVPPVASDTHIHSLRLAFSRPHRVGQDNTEGYCSAGLWPTEPEDRPTPGKPWKRWHRWPMQLVPTACALVFSGGRGRRTVEQSYHAARVLDTTHGAPSAIGEARDDVGASERPGGRARCNTRVVFYDDGEGLAEREGFELGGRVLEFSNLLISLDLTFPSVPSNPRICHQFCHQNEQARLASDSPGKKICSRGG